MNTTTLRTEEPIDPKTLLALGEITEDRMRVNRDVLANMLTETMLLGFSSVLIDEDGVARPVNMMSDGK